MNKPCGCIADCRPCAKACGLDMAGWQCEAETPKAKVTQVIFERTEVPGQRPTFRIISRHGEAGGNPLYNILHDSHFLDAAQKECRRAIKDATRQKIDAITSVKPVSKLDTF